MIVIAQKKSLDYLKFFSSGNANMALKIICRKSVKWKVRFGLIGLDEIKSFSLLDLAEINIYGTAAVTINRQRL